MSTQSQPVHGASKVPREKPSKVTKQRLGQILQQEVQECGRAARQMCQQSGSREVLMKSAKRMASREVAMENTLGNLRQLEQLLETTSKEVDVIGQRLERTSEIQRRLAEMTGVWTAES